MRVLIGLSMMLFLLVAAPTLATAAEKGMCVVCQVKSGESKPEAVKAERTHEGIRYAFCSADCAKESDADPVAYAKPVFPRRAPPFALTTLTGTAVSLEALEGKVALVDFWATWCVPCRKSMPELNVLHAKYAERGFTVVGISIDEDGADKVKKFVSAKKLSYPIAIDGGKSPAWPAFRVKAVPAAYLIDREGRIVAQWLGASAKPEEVEQKLRALLTTP